MSGLTGKQLKWGPTSGFDHPSVPVGLYQSQTIAIDGARFMTIDTGTGYAKLSTASSVLIFGWADIGALANDSTVFISSATAGADVAAVIVGSDVTFRIPVSSGTFAQTNIGLACDLAVVSNKQGAAVGTTTRSLLIVVGGDLANNEWVDVIMNPTKRV